MKRTIDMTEGPIVRPLITFMLPLIGTSIFQQLYNTVDFLFVGNLLDRTAAAAVGASSTLITCMIGLFSGISVGTVVVAAQAVGAGEQKRAEQAVHASVTFGLAGGAVVTILGILLAPWILVLLRTPETVLSQAVTYMRIYLISVPMMIFYNMISGGMRACGDSGTPFRILVICGIVNVLMDAVFIIWIPLGVTGVAVATAVSQTLSALLAALLAARPGTLIRFSPQKLGFYPDTLGAVMRIGLPTGIQTIIITFSNIMVQYHINDFGELAVAAFTTYYKVESLIYLPILAFGQASTTFAGQNTGAGRFFRVRRGTVMTAAIGVGVVACIAGAILLFPRTVFGWFMKDQDVVTCALTIARVSFPFYWIYPLLEVLGGAVRGMGYALRSMVVIICNLCVVRVGLLAVFSRVFHTIPSLGAVYPITWATAAICFAVVFWGIIRRKCGDEQKKLL